MTMPMVAPQLGLPAARSAVLAGAIARMRGVPGGPPPPTPGAPPAGAGVPAGLPPGMEVPARPPANMLPGGGFGAPTPGGGAPRVNALQGALARFRRGPGAGPGPNIAPGVRPGGNPGASY